MAPPCQKIPGSGKRSILEKSRTARAGQLPGNFQIASAEKSWAVNHLVSTAFAKRKIIPGSCLRIEEMGKNGSLRREILPRTRRRLLRMGFFSVVLSDPAIAAG